MSAVGLWVSGMWTFDGFRIWSINFGEWSYHQKSYSHSYEFISMVFAGLALIGWLALNLSPELVIFVFMSASVMHALTLVSIDASGHNRLRLSSKLIFQCKYAEAIERMYTSNSIFGCNRMNPICLSTKPHQSIAITNANHCFYLLVYQKIQRANESCVKVITNLNSICPSIVWITRGKTNEIECQNKSKERSS